jgi:hypothetical protein
MSCKFFHSEVAAASLPKKAIYGHRGRIRSRIATLGQGHLLSWALGGTAASLCNAFN